MIIFISWPVILFCIGVWAVFSAICAVIYGIQNSWDDDRFKWLRVFSVKEKWGLFGLLVGIFAGVGAFLYGWFYHNGYAGLFGFLGAITFSVVAAYICSPFKFDWESAASPIGVISSLASLLLIVAFSWIFILIAIFRKSTWRLYVGIVAAIALFFASAAVGVVIYENAERNETLKKAESYIASAEYEKAMDIYERLSEEEKYLQTKYDYALWYLEQGEYYKSREIFRELAEEHNYLDSAEQILQVSYLWGRYEDCLDYKDARERYQEQCYTAATKKAEKLAGWEDAVEYFQKAGDYKDAKELAVYYQARIQGQEDLLKAESLLRELPRDFLDVDIMLSAIEKYRDLGGTYTLKTSSGKEVQNYTKVTVALVYHRIDFPADAHIKWKVNIPPSRYRTYYSDGEMPKNGVLKFEDGSTDIYKFEITQNRVNLTRLEEYSFGKLTDYKESKYVFEKEN